MFYIFKIFRRIENFLFAKFVRFLFVIGFRKIPRIKNLSRIIYNSRKALYNRLYEIFKPKGVVLVEILGNKLYADTSDKDITPKFLTDGFNEEKYETALFEKIVEEEMIVVDVGANVGYYSLLAARLVGNSGMVYAFEPMPKSYELLCKNIDLNHYDNVIAINKAVSNRSGRAKFWYERDWWGSPSFSQLCVLTVSKHKTFEEGGFIEVETIALDEFFENVVGNLKVDVIKVDTGGAEGLVTEGVEKIFRSNNNLKVFMEWWPDALNDLGTDPLQLLYKLQEYGFEIKFINEAKQVIEPIDIEEEKYRTGMGFNLLLEK